MYAMKVHASRQDGPPQVLPEFISQNSIPISGFVKITEEISESLSAKQDYLAKITTGFLPRAHFPTNEISKFSVFRTGWEFPKSSPRSFLLNSSSLNFSLSSYTLSGKKAGHSFNTLFINLLSSITKFISYKFSFSHEYMLKTTETNFKNLKLVNEIKLRSKKWDFYRKG